MDLYAIRRRHIATTPEDFAAADARSAEELASRTDRMLHVRTYLVVEDDGATGSVCHYRAVNAEVIREHARAAEIPADEVLLVREVVVSESDDEPTPAQPLATR